jgi:hypothetical protein
MSSGWYCKRFECFNDASYEAMDNIDNGNTVAFGDDIEYFAEQMKIKVTDIQEVK